jgi:hypothetical protein
MKRLTKYIGLFLLAFLAIILLASIFLYQNKVPHKLVKEMVQKELCKAFSQKVTVGDLSGNLFNQVKLSDVRFYNNEKFPDGILLEIGELHLNYNIFVAMRRRNDIIAGTSSMDAYRVKLNILRSKEDLWNILYIIPPPPKILPPPPLTLTGKVNIHDLDISFIDEKGWGESVASESFVLDIEDMKGVVDFKDRYKVQILLNGNVYQTGAPIKFKGYMNAFTGMYDLDFFMPRLAVEKWGYYVFNHKGFGIEKGLFSVKGHLRSKDPYPARDIPFWYDLNLDIRDSLFIMPFFSYPIEKMNALLRFRNGSFGKEDLRKVAYSKKGFNNRIWDELVKLEVLDTEGMLKIRIPADDDNVRLRFSKSLRRYQRKIVKALKEPKLRMEVVAFDGVLSDVPAKGSGVFLLDEHEMHLDVSSEEFELKQLRNLFAGLKNWKLEGIGKTDIIIEGGMSNPKVDGVLRSDSLTLYALRAKDSEMQYSYFNKKLNLDLVKNCLYDGNLSGKGFLDFNDQPARIKMAFSGRDLDIKKALPSADKDVSGNFDITANLDGTTTRYDAVVSGNGTNLVCYSQQIDNLDSKFVVDKNKDIYVKTVNVYLNGGDKKLVFSGDILNLIDGSFDFKGRDLLFRDLDPSSDISGGLDIKGNLFAKMVPVFWKQPYKEMVVTMSGQLRDYSFYGQSYDSVDISLIYDKMDISLKKLFAENTSQKVDISGSFEKHKPVKLNVKLNKFDIKTSSLLQKYIPEKFKPFSGLLSTDINLSKNKKIDRNQKLKYWNWLRNYKIEGALFVDKGVYQGQDYEKGELIAKWSGVKLNIAKGSVKQKQTNLDIKGSISLDKNIALQILEGTVLDFDDLSVITAPLGDLSGMLRLNGSMKGQWFRPRFDFRVYGEYLRGGFVALDKIQGRVRYDGNKLSFNSLDINFQEEEYSLDGYFGLKKILEKTGGSFLDIDYQLLFKAKKGDLKVFVSILESIQKEVKTRSSKIFNIGNEKISNSNITVDHNRYAITDKQFDDNVVSIYSRDRKGDVVSFFDEIRKNNDLLIKPPEIGLGKLFGGKFSGEFYAKSRKNKAPLIRTDIMVVDADIFNIKAKKIHFGVYPQKKYMTVGLVVDDGARGGRTFQKISCAGFMDDAGVLNLTKSNVIYEDILYKKVITGQFPLQALWDNSKSNRAIKAKIKLDGNSIGLYSFFNPNIERITNDGIVRLDVGGSWEDPVINAEKISLVNTGIYFSDLTFFRSPFVIKENVVDIKDNVIMMPKLALEWKGIDTQVWRSSRKVLNKIDIEGFVKIESFNIAKLDKVLLDMDLKIKDQKIMVNFPKIYNGDLAWSDCRIKGVYTVPISEKEKSAFFETLATNRESGPVIYGDMVLSNGEIIMPTVEKKVPKPPFLLDMTCGIEQGMIVGGSLFGSNLGGFANMFDLTLKKTEEPLIVNGALNAPIIKNKVLFFDGDINILNHNFELIKKEKQTLFYREDKFKVKENTLSFDLAPYKKSEKMRIVPIFDIKAMTVIEPEIEVSANITEQEPYKYVVVAIDGPVYEMDRVSIEEYEGVTPEPNETLKRNNIYYLTSGQGASNDSSSRDTIEIVRLLMPELLPEEGKIFQPNQLLYGIGENRINSLIRRNILRPIERQVANQMGLYDLKVDYNVGRALLDSASSLTGGGENTIARDNVLGVDMVTNMFSDKLFFRVKTNVNMSSEEKRGQVYETFQVSEVELTYYLLRNLSVNYAEVKDALYQEGYISRFSLKWSWAF